MPTSLVSFVLNNLQSSLAGGATVTANPLLQTLERQSALSASGRVQGGASFNQGFSTVTNSIQMLDDILTRFDNDGYAKHGFILLSLAGTTAQTASLLLTTTGPPAGTAGDTVFALWNKLFLLNLSATDCTFIASTTNPASLLGLAPSGTPGTIRANSWILLNSVAGEVVNSTHLGITVTPAATGLFAIGVAGS